MYTIAKHGRYPYVTVVAIPFSDIKKIDFALCKQPTETPDAYYKRQTEKPDIITNGGFFNMSNGETCFGYRDEGVSINFTDYAGVGITGDKSLSYGKNLSQNSSLRDFIAAYPPLVEYGSKVKPTYAKELDYNARRTAIGWSDKEYFVVTVDSPGLKYSEVADVFINLGASFAINLDGGGSTRLLIDGVRKTSTIYARPVDNVMCVYLYKEGEDREPTPAPIIETPNVIYRVQVGAFTHKDNAEFLLSTIKSKGFTDAYIRKVGNYYKVQVGAYSVKLNAERMKDRVVSAGFKAITTTK